MRQGLQHLPPKYGLDREILKALSRDFPTEKFLTEFMGIQEFEKQGDEYIHRCVLPFGLHRGGDSSPSASFNSSMMVMNCFVCGGGSLLWWIQQVQGKESNAALNVLKQWVKGKGKSDSQDTFTLLQEIMKGESSFQQQVLPSYSEKIIEPWVGFNPYFTERGVSEEIQEKMKTGFSDQDQRVVIPVFFKSKLVGWSMRKVNDQDLGSKYKHSHGLPKSSILYNYDDALARREVIVVESPMSTLKLLSDGILSVATMGAQVTQSQMNLLRSFDTVVVAGDGDEAGMKMNNSIVTALRKDTKVEVVVCPPGEDPGELEDPHRYLTEERIPALLWMYSIS